MLRLFSLRSLPRPLSILQRHFVSLPTSTPEQKVEKSEEIAEDPYLNPDWFRTPQASDGSRCIAPDYPNTPYDSYQNRNPHARYYDQQRRRNFNEPVNERFDVLSAQSFDVESTYSMRYMLSGVGIAAAVLFGIIQTIQYFDEPEGWRKNVVPRHLPFLHKYQPTQTEDDKN